MSRGFNTQMPDGVYDLWGQLTEGERAKVLDFTIKLLFQRMFQRKASK